ncbi:MULTISPECIES: ankyrin repeat domain-containing protein [unclassified Francisella]|uniref:ankyrin repeat domain-containing protein n=1 Tax=unclassified Francisella TaxID=2610885 RepID=UPI002E36E685|nr:MULTISPECIES: ankyrin repeat domain-containing protein [unclassified Francisella]MED7818913.1 ankyrin repeat domain-containing protein [Francisella sp. 19S2-4]MED7829750.1 ankyrin repeat domain-containing protein [Francisella sp. 19S2-10]
MNINILKLLKALGYPIVSEGMCLGIAYMAIQAIIRNKIDDYIIRINLINDYINRNDNENDAIKALVNDIDVAYNKRANIQTRHLLTYDENKLLDILAWLEGVQIYNGLTFRYFDDHHRYSTNNYKKHTEFFNSQFDRSNINLNSDQYGNIFLQSKDSCFLTEEKITEILSKIKNSKQSIAFSISTADHTIAIGKSKSVREIFLISHDIFIKVNDNNKFTIPHFCQSQDNDSIAVSILEFSNNRLQDQKNNFIQDISKLSDTQIKNLVYIALQDDHSIAVKAYIKAILEKNININQKIELLAAKSSSQFPGLFVALQNGHSETIDAYIQSIMNSNIPNVNKVELLAAKNINRTPGIFIALENGYRETIDAYMQSIMNSNIPNVNKVELLAAKDINYKPGLFVALQNRHNQIVDTYLKINLPNLSNRIVYGFSQNMLMKELLLKWALEYKPNEIKYKVEYPLLIQILSYNRFIFAKNPTESMQKLNNYTNWR